MPIALFFSILTETEFSLLQKTHLKDVARPSRYGSLAISVSAWNDSRRTHLLGPCWTTRGLLPLAHAVRVSCGVEESCGRKYFKAVLSKVP